LQVSNFIKFKGDRSKPKTNETGFLTKSRAVTNYSRKNPVSRRPYKNLGMASHKRMCLADNKLMDRAIPNPKSP